MKFKKHMFRLMALITVLMFILTMMAPAALAATPQQIEDAIDAGLVWLASQQQPDGSWSQFGNAVGHTGLVLLKFETHATFMGLSPLDPAYAYSGVVEDGLNYLFNVMSSEPIAVQPAGNPDTNGNGIGVACPPPGGFEPFYEQGIALMALVASNEPGMTVGVGTQNGRFFFDVAVDMLDYIFFAQNESPGAPASRGGWRYDPNSFDSDNSVSGYLSLALAYAEAPAPFGFGIPIPPWVLSELNLFVTALQDPVNGDPDDGGSWYVPQSWSWINILKTGNLLAEMALVGNTQATPRVQDAVDYIERHWNDLNPDPGWRNNYQATFTTMKGFQALGIGTIDTGGGPFSWYNQMADMIVTTQNPGGSWPGDQWGDPILTTAWAMLTLEKAAPPALSLLPPFDINPPGTSHTVTATYKLAGVPQVGVTINFEVITGPNVGDSGFDVTNANGQAQFTYTGSGGPGTDIIKATAVDQSGAPLVSAQATKVWETGGGPGPEVGGDVYPVNKATLLAPWIALAVAMITGAAITMRRRHSQS